MITGSIITRNESGNIVACMESLRPVCDEIYVVDSLSTDDTVELARAHGAHIIEHQYLGDGPQRNLVVPHAKNDWILSLDADERLTPELVEEINALDLEQSSADAYSMKRRNFLGSRWIRHCGWYPDRVIRLYNRTRVTHGEGKAHSSDLPTDNVTRLHSDMLHQTFNNIGEVFAKPDRNYPRRGAKILYLKGRKANSLTPVVHGLSSLLKHYVIKRGFLDGLDGLTVSLGMAMNSYIKYARLLEYQRDTRVRDAEDFDSVW